MFLMSKFLPMDIQEHEMKIKRSRYASLRVVLSLVQTHYFPTINQSSDKCGYNSVGLVPMETDAMGQCVSGLSVSNYFSVDYNAPEVSKC